MTVQDYLTKNQRETPIIYKAFQQGREVETFGESKTMTFSELQNLKNAKLIKAKETKMYTYIFVEKNDNEMRINLKQ